MPRKNYSLDNIVPVGTTWIGSDTESIYFPTVLKALLSSNDKVLRRASYSGVLTKDLEELFTYIKSFSGRMIVDDEKGGHFSFVWKDSYLGIAFNKKTNNIRIGGYYLDESLTEMFSFIDTSFVSKEKKNLVFTIVKTSSGFDIQSLGDGHSPLITDNYLPDVITDIDFVVNAFSKSPPAGRIAILNGEPGTGKTHLIRSFLSRIDCLFLIVPSSLIDSLDKPELVPLLTSVRNSHEKPIILIIEDGDTCLVPRKNDNISTIAALLNLSDGIMGSIIDIKMIISTNAEIKDMDPAILRPGRLSRNIYVGPLPYDQANVVYRRLMANDTATLEYRRFYTLAEIYDKFNNIDIATTVSSSKQMREPIGFAKAPSLVDRTLNKVKIGFGS